MVDKLKNVVEWVAGQVMWCCTVAVFSAATLYYTGIMKILQMTDTMWVVTFHIR